MVHGGMSFHRDQAFMLNNIFAVELDIVETWKHSPTPGKVTWICVLAVRNFLNLLVFSSHPQPYLASMCSLLCQKRLFFHRSGLPALLIWPHNSSALFNKAQPGTSSHKSSLARSVRAELLLHIPAVVCSVCFKQHRSLKDALGVLVQSDQHLVWFDS